MQASAEQLIDLAADLTPADRVLAIAGSIAFGTFRAKPSEPVFAGSSGLSCYYLVFPRTCSEIRLDRGPRGVVGPVDLAAYNPGDSYRRSMVSPEGDRSDYIAVEKKYMRDLLLGELDDLPPEASGDVLLGRMHVIQSRSLFLSQRSLFERLIAAASAPAGSPVADRFGLEEAGLGLILASLQSGIAGRLPRPPASSERRHRDLVETAKRLLAQRFLDRLTLDELAAGTGASAGHLARLFRRHAGMSIHQYLTELRLRETLELLAGTPASNTDVAAHLGFSHHSHFTAAFRRAFGVTPSAYTAAAPGARTRRRMTARQAASRLLPH